MRHLCHFSVQPHQKYLPGPLDVPVNRRQDTLKNMSRFLITSPNSVTLIGGGAVRSEVLATALSHAPVLVAADGGAETARTYGQHPTAIIGDLDSIVNREYWQNSDVAVYQIDDQDTTDFEKCLQLVQAPLVLGVGFLGARTDHMLAALSALMRFRQQPVVLLGEEDLVFLAPKRLSLSLSRGSVVSLYPLVPVRGVRSQGLEWPVDGLSMQPGGVVGTSNRMKGAQLELEFDSLGMLLILPLDALGEVVRLLSTPGR
ncbi:MAG: thiamine diphosphokinase [Pseudomonadota bacterium]